VEGSVTVDVTKTPTICPELLMSKGEVRRLLGTLMVLNLPPVEKPMDISHGLPEESYNEEEIAR